MAAALRSRGEAGAVSQPLGVAVLRGENRRWRAQPSIIIVAVVAAAAIGA